MDNRLALLLGVFLFEALLQFFHALIALDPLQLTLIARLIEGGAILIVAPKTCGIRAASLGREIAVGAACATGFGLAVLAVDWSLRAWGAGGFILSLAVQPVASPLLFAVTGCLAAPFVEELFFRGLFYQLLRERLNAPVCIALSALIFASMHGRIAPVQLAGGLLLGALYEWRGNIWPGFVLHAAANAGIWLLPGLLV